MAFTYLSSVVLLAVLLNVASAKVDLLPVPNPHGVTSFSKHPCTLPLAIGRCRGSFPRVYYDSSANQCKEFTYGGCGGNANNFGSIADCENACGLKHKISFVRGKGGIFTGRFPGWKFGARTVHGTFGIAYRHRVAVMWRKGGYFTIKFLTGGKLLGRRYTGYLRINLRKHRKIGRSLKYKISFVRGKGGIFTGRFPGWKFGAGTVHGTFGIAYRHRVAVMWRKGGYFTIKFLTGGKLLGRRYTGYLRINLTKHRKIGRSLKYKLSFVRGKGGIFTGRFPGWKFGARTVHGTFRIVYRHRVVVMWRKGGYFTIKFLAGGKLLGRRFTGYLLISPRKHRKNTPVTCNGRPTIKRKTKVHVGVRGGNISSTGRLPSNRHQIPIINGKVKGHRRLPRLPSKIRRASKPITRDHWLSTGRYPRSDLLTKETLSK